MRCYVLTVVSAQRPGNPSIASARNADPQATTATSLRAANLRATSPLLHQYIYTHTHINHRSVAPYPRFMHKHFPVSTAPQNDSLASFPIRLMRQPPYLQQAPQALAAGARPCLVLARRNVTLWDGIAMICGLGAEEEEGADVKQHHERSILHPPKS